MSPDDPNKQRELAASLQKVAELERCLAMQQTSAADVNSLRGSLCETLSDILLLDPTVAHEQNCVGRLWRTCFYARIGKSRGLLAKLQPQHPQYQQQHQALQQFLQEGVTLYDYLRGKLQEQLFEQRTTTSTGLVPCLQRCTINLGDLYRYAGQSTLATQCYTTAAALAPGSGHPWNQVAVSSNDTAVDRLLDTVYWYVRALGAQADPFPTASSNCKRIVSSYQAKHKNATAASIVVAGKTTRLFLGELVCAIVDTAKADSAAAVRDDATHNRQLELVSKFKEHLQASLFSDSLVLKLMCILLYYNASDLLLAIAGAVAERCHMLVESKVAKAIPCYGCRGLVVLTMTAEYCLLHLKDDAYRQQHVFWKELVATYNLLRDMKKTDAAQLDTLPERQNLRGFLRPSTLYVTNAEAAAILREQLDSGSTTTPESETVTRNRTAHFLNLPIAEHLPFVKELPDGSLEYEDPEPEEEEEQEDEGGDDLELKDFVMPDAPHDDHEMQQPQENIISFSRPTLVYKEPGEGPRLLVPSMLTSPPPTVCPTPMAPTPPLHTTPLPSSSMSRLPPPPGFGPPNTTPPAASLLGTWMQPLTTSNPFASAANPLSALGAAPPPPPSLQQQQQDNLLLHNLLLGESTKNPFAGR